MLPVLLGSWLLALSTQAAVVINEVHYDPDVKTEPLEFIELFNSGSLRAYLAGCQNIF